MAGESLPSPREIMTTMKRTREVPRIDLPRPLLYGIGVTCGVLAAIVVQILLSRAGFELAGAWRDLVSPQALQLRAAGAWWVIASAAFLAGAVMTAVLSRMPL